MRSISEKVNPATTPAKSPVEMCPECLGSVCAEADVDLAAVQVILGVGVPECPRDFEDDIVEVGLVPFLRQSYFRFS